VATTTLEVGIDIGDVDAVVNVGAPPNTLALLQRIGRSGRREGCVKLIPIVRNCLEARAFASMLFGAFVGELEEMPKARLWSVFIQQAVSHIIQSGQLGRRRTDLLTLAQSVWPESQGPLTASQILDFLVEQEILIQRGDRLYLGDEWSDRFERAGGNIHHNFDADGQGIPVVDASTGELITHVSESPKSKEGIALAGQRWEIVNQAGEILLKSRLTGKGENTFRYTSKGAPMTKIFAEHIRRGLGFEDNEAPIIDTPSRTLWFHFGGLAYETMLQALFPGLSGNRLFRGIALRGIIEEHQLQSAAESRDQIKKNLNQLSNNFTHTISFGRYHRYLPEQIKSNVANEMFNTQTFVEWLITREVGYINSNERKGVNLLEIVKECCGDSE
jgi:ATP-dependent helicase Lhr and Lhr-like helicase